MFGFKKKQKEESVSAVAKQVEAGLGISALELDALKETANIGTGNASIALSNIFKKKVNISLPVLNLSDASHISTMISGPDEMIVGIYSKIMEGMEGNILMIMPINSAINITKTFIKDEKQDQKSLSEKDRQLLQKIGTAIYASYLTSLAKFFEKKITFAPPNVISTHGNAINDFLLLHMGQTDKFIMINLGFDVDTTTIKGDFMLLFTTESIAPLLANIKSKLSS